MARTLLARGGIEGCSMRAVAEGSGVTAAAIYKHFRDKGALVDHLVALSLESFEESLLAAITPLPVGSFERLSALGEGYLRFAAEHEEEFKILFMPLLGGRRKLSDLPGQGGYRILRQCVQEAIDSGALRQTQVDLASLFLWSRVHGIVMLCLACDLGDIAGDAGDFADAIDGPPAAAARELFKQTQSFLLDGLRA